VTTRPQGRTPDFGRRAAVYDRLRPYDENWREVAETLIREADLAGRRVLDVGCGTGRFLAQLAQVAKAWGVDASPEMLEVARTRAGVAGLKLGIAEQLPFKDGWFERATMWLVAHLVDRPRAFAEARRVLAGDGRFGVATIDPSYFDGFWLNELFPSMERADRERFPTAAELEAELRVAGLEPRLLRLSQRGSLTRDVALERIRGKHISTFDLISDEEYEAGLARAERDLPEWVDYAVEWLVVIGSLAE
jgi:ubiquinone/menaquinone biosynthesis C-methylase UbiE